MTRLALGVATAFAALALLVGWQLAEARGDVAKAEAALAAGKVREVAAQARYDSLTGAQRARDRVTTRLVTKWDTLKAGVDTLLLHDTVQVPVEIVRTVFAVADSAVQACVLGRQTCEERVLAQSERADALAGQRDAIAGQLRAAQRSALWGKVGAFGVGAVAGLLLVRR